MRKDLLAGFAEIDITPPVGTLMCGSLKPRPSVGIQDPLMLKAVVLESRGVRIAYAIFDVAMLTRRLGDRCVSRASRRTGIPAASIAWACSHTHTGPYTDDAFPYRGSRNPVNHAWLSTLPAKFAECLARADAAKEPVRVSRLRAYTSCVSHNRRYRYKDGREINTWLLNSGEDDLQCVGAAGPIDPEIGGLAFDDRQGRLRGLLFCFTLHANANFGDRFSGDYPAVVAARIRECHGPDVSTLFVPEACGDLNPVMSYRQTGDVLAGEILRALDRRRPTRTPVTVGARRRDLTVPYRNWRVSQDGRIDASQWPKEIRDLFRQNLAIIRRRGETSVRTRVTTWHVGDVAFAGLPGEPFVEVGLALKRRSPFPWTYPVELCGDYAGYLVTRQAWESGGYEGLISTVAPVDVRGVEMMSDAALHMLAELRAGPDRAVGQR